MNPKKGYCVNVFEFKVVLSKWHKICYVNGLILLMGGEL